LSNFFRKKVVQKIVKFCELPKLLPRLNLLDKEMESFKDVVQKNKQECLPTHCAAQLQEMQEKVVACKQHSIEGQNIVAEAVSLAEQARSLTKFAQIMVKTAAQFAATK